ncbi:hypothetical protein RDABS01_025034 [Bienertia sinuspersici]
MCWLYKKYSLVLVTTLTILALFSIIIQSKGSNNPSNNFLFFPSSSWTWLKSKTTHTLIDDHHGITSSSSPSPSSSSQSTSSSLSDSLAHSLGVINNSSSLSKSEEKRQRTMMKLREEIEKVLIMGRKKDENMETKEIKLTKARALIKQAFKNGITSNISIGDDGPRATWYHPLLYFNSIRALCNANTSENFNPRKDVSIPEINLATDDKFPEIIHGSPLSNRTVLAFFAGRMHGRIRPLLLNYWKDKHDQEMQVYEHLPKEISYHEMMKQSKYCLCPSGFEVASPRVVEAIYAECVPVLISQNYIPPFSDVLDWNKFSVQVSVSDIQNLKKILMEIPHKKYLQLQEGVKQVQQHFVMNDPPKRFDVFHMIIHSIWLRRLNVRIHS